MNTQNEKNQGTVTIPVSVYDELVKWKKVVSENHAYVLHRSYSDIPFLMKVKDVEKSLLDENEKLKKELKRMVSYFEGEIDRHKEEIDTIKKMSVFEFVRFKKRKFRILSKAEVEVGRSNAYKYRF